MFQESKRRHIQLLLEGKKHSVREISSIVGVSIATVLLFFFFFFFFYWPSQSPDINPIENLFAWLQQKLIKKGPKSITKLKEELTDLWENINSEFLENY